MRRDNPQRDDWFRLKGTVGSANLLCYAPVMHPARVTTTTTH
jgi:hypothetical protein